MGLQWEECFFRFILFVTIGIGRGHPSTHGCTEDLMYMCVHEFESAVFEDEIKIDVYYVGWWAV